MLHGCVGSTWGICFPVFFPTHSSTLSSLSTLHKIIIFTAGLRSPRTSLAWCRCRFPMNAAVVPGAGMAERKGLWVWIYVSVPSACEVRKQRAGSQSHTHAHLRKKPSPQPIVLGLRCEARGIAVTPFKLTATDKPHECKSVLFDAFSSFVLC